MDKHFITDIVNLRIAEVAYKLGLLEVSLDALTICDQIMVKDRHIINLMKGKCYDKKRHFGWSVEEYECGLLICLDQKV